MATPPTNPIHTFATDTNYSSGEFAGQATRVAPTVSEIAQGYRPKDRPPARKLNWLLNNIGQWLGYLEAERGEHAAKLNVLVPGFGGNTIRTYGRESLTYVTNSPGLVEFEPNGFGEPWQIARFAEPNAEEIWIALTPTAPAGARIVQVSWWVQGAAWATMPSVPAYVDLIQRNVITGATTSVISFSDAAANIGELNSARQITTNVVSHTISSACQYYLKLVGPTGGTGVGRSLTARGAYIGLTAA